MTYIESSRGSCRHGLNLVDDLLTLFKASRRQISREMVVLTRLMSTISEMVGFFKEERKAKIFVQEGLATMGGRMLLTIALQNLFENSWKFTSSVENAIIEFGFDDSGENPAFFLHDNGCGFRKDHADKIFTPFHRAHSHDEYPGTGLGLATVHRIIFCHGGHIWTQSESRKGATLVLSALQIRD